MENMRIAAELRNAGLHATFRSGFPGFSTGECVVVTQGDVSVAFVPDEGEDAHAGDIFALAFRAGSQLVLHDGDWDGAVCDAGTGELSLRNVAHVTRATFAALGA